MGKPDTDTDLPPVPPLPTVARDGCPHCGFAMNRELDKICLRCKQSPDAPVRKQRAGVAAAAPIAAPRPVAAAAAAAPGAAARGWLIALAVVLPVVAVGAGLALLAAASSPAGKAAAKYRQGLARHEQSDLDAAIALYREALELDPTFAIACVAAGFAVLRVSEKGATEQELKRLVEQATWGNTQSFDVCDAWMQDAIPRCDKAPERVHDRSVGNNTRVKAWAEAGLAMTAFLRAGAAGEARKIDQVSAWLNVTERHLQAAETIDPKNRLTPPLRREFNNVKAMMRSIQATGRATRGPF